MQKSTHTGEYRRMRAELRRIRVAAGLSQRELGERLRVPHTWVAKVEAGERRIDVIELGWFVAACGADVVDVFTSMHRGRANPRSSRKGGREARE